MGYVNPDPEPEPGDFEDQFQWDGQAWLFRRFQRALPVRVSPQEMEHSISFYQRWQRRIHYASATLAVGLVIGWDLFGSEEWERSHIDMALVAGGSAYALAWIARNWVWRRAVDRFANRVPVGPGQSWIDDRESRAKEASWLGLLAPVGFIGGAAAMLFYIDPTDQRPWLELGAYALIGITSLCDIALKLKARFL